MANLNRVLLIGNLTRDPELTTTPKGSKVTKFGLAVNRSYKNGSGDVVEETTFIEIESWGRQAEGLAKYLSKASALFVEGRLRFDSWEDKNTGQKRSRLSVVLENFQFIEGGKRKADSSESPPSGPAAGGADAEEDEPPF